MLLRVCYKLILFTLLPCTLMGTELYNRHFSVRALGMGNAFIAVVDDNESLFYNPAGLGKIQSISVQPFKLQIGTNEYVSGNYEQAVDLTSEDGFLEALRELYGDSLWVGAGGYFAVSVPNFAVAVYDSFNASADLSNPALPNLQVNYVNDFGGAAGFAFDLFPKTLTLGLVGKYIQRTGATSQVSLNDLATINESDFADSLKNEGTGYALDAGINIQFPTPVKPTFSFVHRNIGNTKFTKKTGSPLAPPTDFDEMAAGIAFELKIPGIAIRPAAEYRYINEQQEDIQLGKKIHLGVELDLPLLSARAGLHQGYWTLGAGFDMGLFRVEAATYGVELGEYPGQREDRRYVIEITMDLGFDLGSKSFLNLDKSSQRRLKQRR